MNFGICFAKTLNLNQQALEVLQMQLINSGFKQTESQTISLQKYTHKLENDLQNYYQLSTSLNQGISAIVYDHGDQGVLTIQEPIDQLSNHFGYQQKGEINIQGQYYQLQDIKVLIGNIKKESILTQGQLLLIEIQSLNSLTQMTIDCYQQIFAGLLEQLNIVNFFPDIKDSIQMNYDIIFPQGFKNDILQDSNYGLLA